MFCSFTEKSKEMCIKDPFAKKYFLKLLFKFHFN